VVGRRSSGYRIEKRPFANHAENKTVFILKDEKRLGCSFKQQGRRVWVEKKKEK
jgi:hypothetical protein